MLYNIVCQSILDITWNGIDEDDDYTEAFVNMISVDVKAYAKEHFEKSVKKTLTIPSWLNNLAEQNNVNFSNVLQNALKDYLNVNN